MKKELKRPNSKGAGKDREFGVILEKIDSNIEIIIEDLTTVKNRVETIFEKQGKLREELLIVKADIRIIKTDIAEIKTTFKGQDNRITHLEAIK